MKTIYRDSKDDVMNNYIIEKIDKDYAAFLVFGTSVESPLFELSEIQEDLNTREKEELVLFDQLLQTGNSENRFLTMKIVDGCFDYESAKNVDAKTVDDEVKSFICSFLRNNTAILKHSILLSDQKNAILCGGIV